MTNPLRGEYFTHQGKNMVRITSVSVPSFSVVRLEDKHDRERLVDLSPKKEAPVEKAISDLGPDLNAMTKDELLAYADENGIAVKKSDRKADILKAIKAA